MARIRTIKPEFPQSESMGRVSRESRFCFVLLWTLADDEGRLRGNSRMLASLLYPYDDDASSLIDGWLAELEKEGCLVRYQVDGTSYLQIAKWLNHQKIDKPTKSKFPPFEEGSRILANPRESSPLDLGSKDLGSKDLGSKDLGEDQGKDLVAQPEASRPVEKNRLPEKIPPKPKPTLEDACGETWERYRLAYQRRYGVDPVRNTKVNAQVKQFCKSLPLDESPQVAEFFVCHNLDYYVRKGHDIGVMLTDATKLRTEWATGRMMTGTRARQVDRTASMLDAGEQVKREMGWAT